MVVVRVVMTIPAHSSPVDSHVSRQVELERFGWNAVAQDWNPNLNPIGEGTPPNLLHGKPIKLT